MIVDGSCDIPLCFVVVFLMNEIIEPINKQFERD